MDPRIPEEKLDCSPELLILLWKWFRRRAKTESAFYEKEDQNNKFTNDIWNNKRKLTLETEYIIRDIGMYLGETFVKNNPHIDWAYYTNKKRDFFLNHPLLKEFMDRTFGEPFEAYFEHIYMARIQALKILDRTSKTDDLFNLYVLWSQKK